MPRKPTIYRNKTLENRNVNLDFAVFEGCTIRRCRLIYRGEGDFKIRRTDVQEIELSLEGAAARTYAALIALGREDRKFVKNFIAALSPTCEPE